MALDQSVLSELADALKLRRHRPHPRSRASRLPGTDRVRAVLGHRRRVVRGTGSRLNERNGHRPRVVSTKAGDISLGIPKLRKGSFFPSILEPRRRIDQALYAVVMAPLCVKRPSRGHSHRVGDELLEDGVRQPALQTAKCFLLALSFGELSSEVGLPRCGPADSDRWP